MRTTHFLTFAAATLMFGSACTVKDVDAPALAGPSTFARSIVMVADRDALTQNGSDFTDIRITVLGPTGQSENIALRAQVFVDGVAQDYGTLSTKNPITPTTIRYTAPAASLLAAGQVPQTISIRVTPAAAGDFRGEVSREIDVRLIPPGVILPTNPNLAAGFTVTPASPQAFQNANFDASTTTNAGSSCASACLYSWNFGDGTSSGGLTTTHAYRAVGLFPVTLTVTDSRGAQTLTTRTVTVTNPAPPAGNFTVAPNPAPTNVDVFFNASGVTWAGRTITGYSWNFGDGTQGTGLTTTHRYSGSGTFTVTLTMTDDLGATSQPIISSVTVTALGGLRAVLAASTTAPRVGQRVVFDATGSVPSSGASIVSYRFVYGDGIEETSNNPIQSHAYSTIGPVTATVVVTDSNGKTASGSLVLTVAS